MAAARPVHLAQRAEISEATSRRPQRSRVPSKPDLSLPVASAHPGETSADQPQRFAALVAGFGRLVAHAVRQVAGGTAANDLADIEQDVLLALWKRVRAEQDIEHPASYVYKAAIREAVRAVARVRRRAEAPLPEAEAAASVHENDGERLVVEREGREALRAALAALPTDRARAVRAHLAGWSVEEVMRLHGWSYQRARNLIARGMADLRLELRSRGMS